ncbi:MAG TPA: flavin reductase [Candidatus Latescibacteria bacterium]|nr:flavin reductase [Candidatus Latescibacterota bacterium]
MDAKALWSISYGLYVVSSRSGEGRLNGQIANSVFQVTSEPPQVAAAINKGNLTHEYIEESGVFAVSVLSQDVTMKFIGLFGFRSGREVDKLSQARYMPGATGVPVVLDYSVSFIEAEVVGSLDVGTHTIFVGRVVAGRVIGGGRPLTYAEYHELKKGKAPKAAPTYRG